MRGNLLKCAKTLKINTVGGLIQAIKKKSPATWPRNDFPKVENKTTCSCNASPLMVITEIILFDQGQTS